MKRVIYGFLAIFLLYAAKVRADINFNGQPNANSYVSEALYITSNTAANNSTNGSLVVVSSFPGFLYGVTVNTPGTSSGSAKLELFDSSQSTGPGSLRKICTIDTSAKITLLYNTYLSSGLAINNSGANAADVTVIYRIK